MKFSSKVQKCQLSPVRQFNPCAAAAEAKGRTIYHLNIGQPDIRTPDAFFEAVGAFKGPVLEYAPTPGLPEYLDAVRGYYAKLGITLERSDILVTSGAGEALEFVLAAILDDGDELLVPEPFYANYNTFAYMTGGSIRPVPSSPDNGYRYADRALIEPLINEHTRGILVTNPGNPTGVVLTPEEMRVIADIVKEHDLFLVADEVYREFFYENQGLTTFGSLEDIRENLIIVDSISKRFSACGARIGAMISRNRDFMAQAMKLCQGRLCPATIDQIGAAAMYRSVEPSYFEDVRTEYKKRRDTVLEELGKIPGAKFSTPDGAFYIMATLPVDDAEKLQYFLLEEFEDGGDTVMYAPGSGFYADPAKGRSEIRIAYVKNCDYLRRAIQLLGKGVAAYNARRG